MATVHRLKKKKQADNFATQPPSQQVPFNSGQSKIFKNDPKINNQQKQAEYEQYYQISQCNPIGVFPSSTVFPDTSITNHYAFPNCITFSPMLSMENQNCEFMQKTGDKILRCDGCSAYMNCYNTIDKSTFTCFLCGRQNVLDKNVNLTTEMSSSIYQCLSPMNFYPSPAAENCYLFLIDLNQESAKCGMLGYLVAVMKEILQRPEMDDTYIYFFTYDQIFQIYDFSGDEIKCVILDRTISIIDQLEPEFLKDIREKLFELLDSLEETCLQNTRGGSNLTEALDIVIPIAMRNKGKIFIFQSNQGLLGEPIFQQNAPKNKQDKPAPKSVLHSQNSSIMDKYVTKLLDKSVSLSIFCFSKAFKNLRVWADLLKLNNCEILYYNKDSQPDLHKFYYDFNFYLGATYFKETRIEFYISHGYIFNAIYGNFYRLKQRIQYQVNYLDSSKKFFCMVSPSQKTQNNLPYFSIQVAVNYRYQRSDYMTVFTVVYPLTCYIDKLISSIDLPILQAVIHRNYLSILRMERNDDVRKKTFENTINAWKMLISTFKKKESIPEEIMPIFNSYLAMMKSYHAQLDLINNTPMLDRVISQRIFLQSASQHQISNFFNPYLFDLVNLDETMCRQDSQFVYPHALELRFQNVNEGVFLLDNGLSLYIFIAKRYDPTIVEEIFGKSKFMKNQVLNEEQIVETNTFRSQQVQTLIRTLREQKSLGWVPLYIVRCGDKTMNERNFYLNFYMEKYQEFRGYSLSIEQFMGILYKNAH